MSVKTETIEVRRCDFCIRENEARACQHCDKDACEYCGRMFELFSEYWNPKPYAIVMTGRSRAVFTAFICHDCASNELSTVMLRFGFEGQEEAKTKTA